MLVDGYIGFLQESLASEISWNNLMLEVDVKSTLKKMVTIVLDKIRSIKNFIVETVLKIIDAIINLCNRKKGDKGKGKDIRVKVPKALGFSNNIVNEIDHNKIVSLCYSKNDRRDEINARKEKLVSICANARVTEDSMFITVDYAKLQGVREKFKADSERARVHLNGLIKALHKLEGEFRGMLIKSSGDTSELTTKLMNTSCCLSFVNVVLSEFMKTIVNHRGYLF